LRSRGTRIRRKCTEQEEEQEYDEKEGQKEGKEDE
jgi:hypothetical protein